MSDTLPTTAGVGDAEDEFALNGYLREMERLRALMADDQKVIDRLKGEILELKAETRAILETLKGNYPKC